MTKKKVYISARFNEKEEVIRIAKVLEKWDYKVISDWIYHKPIKPYGKNQELSKEYSIDDINNSTQSDYFILLTSEGGTGMYVELGSAIEHCVKDGKPEIYVIGNHLDRCMFYFHPVVKRMKNIEDLIIKLQIANIDNKK